MFPFQKLVQLTNAFSHPIYSGCMHNNLLIGPFIYEWLGHIIVLVFEHLSVYPVISAATEKS